MGKPLDDAPMVGGHVVPFEEYGEPVKKAVRGRPVGSTKAEAKQAVTVRYSPDVLDSFKATGAGWQTRMNDALRDWLRTHPLA